MQPTQDLQPGIASNISHEPLQPSVETNIEIQDLQPGIDNTSGTDATEPTYLINIHNYRNIKSINLPLHSGVTALTGKSNAGKSSIINATKGLLYNQIRKTDIRQGQSSPCIVSLTKPSENKSIVFTLSNSHNEYDIKSPTINTKLEKNGTSTPPEINSVYSIDSQYNFQNQMTPPFLTSFSPQELYQTLNTNQTTDKLQNIIQAIKQDQKQLSNQIQSNSSLNQQLQNQQQSIQAQLNLLQSIPPIDSQLPHLFSTYQQLLILSNDYTQIKSKIQHLQNHPHLSLQFTTPTQQFTPLNHYSKLLQSINGLHSKLLQTQKQSQQYQSLIQHFQTCPLCNQPLTQNHNTH